LIPRVPADEGGKVPLYLDLEPLARAVRVDGHAVDEGAKAPHQWAAVVLRLVVVAQAGGERVHRLGISVKCRRMKGDKFRGFFERCELGLDLQALRLESRDPLASILLFDHPLHDHVDVFRFSAIGPIFAITSR